METTLNLIYWFFPAMWLTLFETDITFIRLLYLIVNFHNFYQLFIVPSKTYERHQNIQHIFKVFDFML